MHTFSESIASSWHSVKTRFSMPPTIQSSRRAFVAATALTLASAGLSVGPTAIAQSRNLQGQRITQSVPTWTASPQTLGPTETPVTFNNQTVRQIVHTTVGGNRVRIRLSNEFGTTPLVIGAASIAQQLQNATVVGGSSRTLTFSGRLGITIPPGAPALSDPIDFNVGPASNLAVSLYLPQPTEGRTVHSLGVQTNYVSVPGNNTAALNFPTAGTALTYYFLTGVSVESSVPVLATLGDSITDGFGSTPGANRRWPNLLFDRLQARGGRPALAIANQGISGNRLLFDQTGPNALARYDRDVLSQPGLRYVIVLEGINDIGQPGSSQPASQIVSADDIIAAHRQLIARAHQKGIRIYGATLTPFEGTIFAGYFTPAGETKRQIVNNFIRTSGEYDAVIDFDAALRDRAAPTRMRAAFDVGDHLHPNDAGYKAMADAVDLSLFDTDLSLLRQEAQALQQSISEAAH